MTLRDLYKKSHWQVAGPTFYQLHLLFDKHYGEQAELVDAIAERIQLLGGVSIAMAPTSRKPPESHALHVVARKCRCNYPGCWMRTRSSFSVTRKLARRASQLGDDGSNDFLVSEVLRTNELQVWFLSEHLVREPLAKAK